MSMTAVEFVEKAFNALDDANSIMIDQYFQKDPSGITYLKITLSEIGVNVMSMDLQITWSDTSTTTHTSQGPDAWQQTVALSLLSMSPV